MFYLVLSLFFASSASADTSAVQTACLNRINAGLIHGAVVGMISADGTESEVFCGDSASDREGYELGSISKSFVGITLAKLSLRGKIDLDGPISAYVPEFQNTYVGTVTARQLATHSARLIRNFPAGAQVSSWGYDEAQLIDFLKSYEPDPKVFPPGIRVYSNLGFGTLGLVLSRVEVQGIEDLLRTEILQPLNLADTGFITSAAKPEALVQGFDVLLQPVTYGPISVPAVAAGGLFSDLHDMMIFLAANLRPDHSELGQAMQLSQKLGLGWDSLPGVLPTWKDGLMSGFATDIRFDPTQGTGTIALGNETNSPSVVTIDSIAFGAPDKATQVQLGSDFLTQVDGKYVSADGLVEIDVSTFHQSYLSIVIKQSGQTYLGRLLTVQGSASKFWVDNGSDSFDEFEFKIDPETHAVEATYFNHEGEAPDGSPLYEVTDFSKIHAIVNPRL